MVCLVAATVAEESIKGWHGAKRGHNVAADVGTATHIVHVHGETTLNGIECTLNGSIDGPARGTEHTSMATEMNQVECHGIVVHI